MDTEKNFVFETPIKPELEDIKEVKPSCEEFSNSEKAEALIRNLNLEVGNTLREDSEENYTINPKMVLEGETPNQYKNEVENLKKILTKQEITLLNRTMKKKNNKNYDDLMKKKNNKNYDDLKSRVYHKITDRFNKFYYRQNIKKSLSPEIKEVLEFFKSDKVYSGIYNLVYHLLSNETRSFVYCYECAWNNKPIPNIQTWEERNDGEYRVLTDSEADNACQDYLDDDYLWKQAVEAGNTTSSLEDWKEEVINQDGRGSLLNGYDGIEESEKVNNTDYYIYRTN